MVYKSGCRIDGGSLKLGRSLCPTMYKLAEAAVGRQSIVIEASGQPFPMHPSRIVQGARIPRMKWPNSRRDGDMQFRRNHTERSERSNHRPFLHLRPANPSEQLSNLPPRSTHLELAT